LCAPTLCADARSPPFQALEAAMQQPRFRAFADQVLAVLRGERTA
jgi:hypothetical protein